MAPIAFRDLRCPSEKQSSKVWRHFCEADNRRSLTCRRSRPPKLAVRASQQVPTNMMWLVPKHWLFAVIALHCVAATTASAAAGPSRLSVDFSSTLITAASAPASVLADMAALYQDMAADGVNNVCTGRLASHVCSPSVDVGISLPALHAKLNLVNLPAQHKLPKLAALGGLPGIGVTAKCQLCDNRFDGPGEPCSCAAPGGKTRCSCKGTLTGQQYFNAKNYGLELARVLVKAVNETNTITGGINANFNSTIRLKSSTLVIKGANGTGGLELDESHLDLMKGSKVLLFAGADMEVEDNSALWLSGGSLIVAADLSNIQTQLAHVLVEEGSVIKVAGNSSWNMTQEFDMTPAQAQAVCNKPFQRNSAAEFCFNNKEACKARADLLSVQELQAVGMLKYPPALDQWGRQAFDYTDDNTYDDYYDVVYEQPKLEPGTCLSKDVCGNNNDDDDTEAKASGRHLLSPAAARTLAAAAPPPVPAEPEGDDDDEADAASPAPATGTAAAADGEDGADEDNKGRLTTTTEINARDSLDGQSYDPAWGEGPYGETLCDAPPGKAFNYYGMLVRSGSKLIIAGNSSWTAYDNSRLFIKDSTLVINNNAQLLLLNSTLVLINSTLAISKGSSIALERFSSLQLYNSRVHGDSAMYALPAGAAWQGQPWVQKGDYRASPGGGLPAFMGAREGVPLGSFNMKVVGFDLEARLMPPAGCSCKAPKVATYLTAV